MVVSEIIESAMRKLGAIASGESLNAGEQADALEALQVMLRSWAAEGLNVYAHVSETFSLISGLATYTWGTYGTIATDRPNRLISLYITDSDNRSIPVEIIGESKYRSFSSKATSGTPKFVYPVYGYGNVTLYLYPVPNTTDTMNLLSLKPFTETRSFGTVDDELSFPSYYQEPIIYSLAVRLAPEFGIVIPPSVATVAANSYTRLINLHSGNKVEPISISIPAGKGSYNINIDG